MRKIIYISALLAGTGSLIAILNGHGGDPLGVWNYRGPMTKGQIFYYIAIVSAVILISPLFDYFIKKNWERKFINELNKNKGKRGNNKKSS